MSLPINITVDKRVFNEKYFDYINDKSSVLLFLGGAGSGKSHFIAQKIILNCLSKSNTRVLYTRKTGRTIRNSQFQLFSDILKEWGMHSTLFNLKESTMDIECVVNGSKMIASGLDDVDKLKSITGIDIIWMEEGSEFYGSNYYDFQQLLLRLRKKNSLMQIIISSNPVLSWIHDFFGLRYYGLPEVVRNPIYNNDFKIIHSTYRDNKFLPEEYINRLIALKKTNKVLYEIYTEGLTSSYDDMRVFVENEDYFVSNTTVNSDYVVYGIDFGYTNPTAIVRCDFDFKNKKVYTKEVLYKNKMTNKDLIDYLYKNISNKFYLACDIAEPQRIEEIKRAGYKVLPVDKNIQWGLNVVKEYKLYIDGESTNLLKELEVYSYSKDKRGNIIRELPVDNFNHLIDAMRYSIVSMHSLMNKKITLEHIKI